MWASRRRLASECVECVFARRGSPTPPECPTEGLPRSSQALLQRPTRCQTTPRRQETFGQALGRRPCGCRETCAQQTGVGGRVLSNSSAGTAQCAQRAIHPRSRGLRWKSAWSWDQAQRTGPRNPPSSARRDREPASPAIDRNGPGRSPADSANPVPANPPGVRAVRGRSRDDGVRHCRAGADRRPQ